MNFIVREPFTMFICVGKGLTNIDLKKVGYINIVL